MGGCYLTCNINNSCAGNCNGCTHTCGGASSKAKPSCLGYCSNSSDSMYTTCAGLATIVFI